MRVFRLAFWLLALPGALLFFALWMTRHLADVQSGALEEREREQQVAARMASAERDTQAYLDRRFAARIVPARACVDRAIRGFGNAGLRDKHVLVLLVATGRRCGEACSISAVAGRLAETYAPHGLHVLLLDTASEYRHEVPAGVSYAHLPDCSALVRDHGDDFLFRNAVGELSSFGHRSERFGHALDPEILVRERLGLPPLPASARPTPIH